MGTIAKILLIGLSVVAITVAAPAEAEEQIPALESNIEPEYLNDAETEAKENTDKRSVSTTFCVEIRPSDPYQKPFQVCEPSSYDPPKYDPKPVKYYAGHGSHGGASASASGAAASAMAFGAQGGHAGEAIGKHMFVKPVYKPVYDPPSVYHMPVAHYVPEQHSHMAYRTIDLGNDDDDSDESMEVESARAAEGRTAYKKKYKKKYKSTGGLVISCQPAAVGYLHDPPHYVMPYGGGYGAGGAGGFGKGGGFGGHLGYRASEYGEAGKTQFGSGVAFGSGPFATGALNGAAVSSGG